MKIAIKIISGFLLCSLLFAQFTDSALQRKKKKTGGSSAVVVTPALISFNGAPSTETTAMGAKVDATCVADGYCTQLVEPTVGGETIIVPYTYESTTTAAHAPTITDDKGGGSSTYTCVTEGNDAQGTARTFAGVCYTINAASGIYNVTVTFPVATNTQGAVGVGVAYNITSFDVSAVNGTQTPTTTYSSGAMTTTANNDLVCELAVGTSTRTDVTAFTAGSGFTLHVADRRDALAFQCQVQSSAGAITPTMTGQSNNYVAVGVSFKSGTSGTAPSGMYIAHLYHLNTATLTAGTYTIEVPTSGNLGVITTQTAGAGPQTLTGISDGTNTYTKCGPSTITNTYTWYTANMTPGVLSVVLTVGSTGYLGPLMFYDIVGAATSQTCIQATGTQISGANGSGTTLPFMYGYAPGATAGMSFGSLGFGFNTATGATGPTNIRFDSNTAGGQVIDGPSVPDENSLAAHRSFSANTPATWNATLSLTLASHDTSTWWGNVSSFQAPGATLLPSVVNTGKNEASAAATTIAVSISPVAGHTLVIAVGNNSSRAITKVCTDNATCAAGNTFTQATSALCSNSTSRGDIWYLLSAPSGVTTVTVTFTGGTAVDREAMVWEVPNLTAFDGGNHLNTQTSSGTTATGAAVTTTGTNGFLAAIIEEAITVTATPLSGNEFISPGFLFINTTDAVSSLISLSAASHTPQWQVSSGSGFCASTAAFK